ncbi:non-ribosomal peptide synthetase [Dyella silvatica]|uniref:non-ribosomal peptide synthetase n=1 Tax=Dyella silvatica TaxID=2992128 RepID=UPI0022514A7D|nr:non-ribosomal peptide synthetase [Dyella silvatica]
MSRAHSPRFVPPALAAHAPDTVVPLSFMQQRLWFIEQLEPGSAAYNVSVMFRLRGRLDRAALRDALQAVVNRHAALRTHFTDVLGEARQVVDDDFVLAMPIDEVREADVAVVARDMAQRAFDLAAGPLVRVRLLAIDSGDHALIVVAHHSVCDQWSVGILIGEAAAFYRGAGASLPALAVTYPDFALWQRGWMTADALAPQLAYWRAQLAGIPDGLDLPSDRPRPATRSGRGARLFPRLPRGLVTSLIDFGRRERATLYITLLAAFDALLWRYTGQSDVVTGAPIAGRNRHELEGLVGFFANTLVLRVDVDGERSFRDLVQRVRAVCLDAYAHQDVPFEQLVDAIKPTRDLSRTPIFEVMFGLQTSFPHVELGESTLAPTLLDAGTATFDLTVSWELQDGELAGWVEYNTDLFDAPTVERMIDHYRILLEAAVTRPDDRLAALPLLGAAERDRVIYAWNRTHTPSPRVAHVAELFDAQARRTPDAIAVLAGDEPVTYRELDQRAERWAAILRARGCGPGARVALALSRGVAFPTMVLAVLKAGAAYVPLDPSYPADRLAFMVRDCAARVLISESAVVASLAASAAEILLVEAPPPIDRLIDRVFERQTASADDLAYVIYTSGSTGKPKGVAMPHRAVLNLITWQAARSPEPMRTLQFASPSFDVSFQELFATWANGGCLVLASEDERRDPDALLRRLAAARVERLFLPFVALHQLAEAAHGRSAAGLALREVITAGEQLRITPAIAALFTQLPACRLYNQYGPTETHLASELPLTGAPSTWDTLPSIGRPIANVRIYVLDADRQPVPIGVPGEAWIAGTGVARGYLGREELTAERFVDDPFASAGERMYKTGDRAKYLATGELVFLGRADDQVKLRGYRIELGEIEAALGSHPAVREAAVIVRHDGSVPRLVGYVTCADAAPTTAAIKDHLRARLPDYMIPAAIVVLPAIPLSPNRKVDRKALPRPDDDHSEYVAPNTALEAQVAAVWAAVLGIERISVIENFFEAGGHSLLATQVVSRLRAALAIDLPVRALFEAPTIAELARRIEGAAASKAQRAIAPVDAGQPQPLSLAQQRLYILAQLEPDGFTYNVPWFVRLRGALDVPALATAIDRVIARHAALRTRFVDVAGEPRQIADASVSPIALVAEPTDAPDLAAIAEARRPFDLAAGPLVRARLLRVADDDHMLIVTAHHLVFDGWSLAILARELGAAYQHHALPAIAVQYADFAAWQRAAAPDAAQLAYWTAQLAGAPALIELPTDRPRPAVQTTRGAAITRSHAPALLAGVHALAQREAATEFMTLLAAFAALLARYAGQPDVVIGTPIAGRDDPVLDGVIGMFVNTLAIRVDADAPSFRDLVHRVRETCLAAFAHQDLAFDQLVAALAPERTPSHTPIYQVMFTVLPTVGDLLAIPGLTVRTLNLHPGMARCDLSLFVTTGDVLETTWEYNRDLFDAATIERMADGFDTLLAALLAAPDQPPAAPSLLADSERHHLLHTLNATEHEYPRDVCLHELIEAQVARSSDAIALTYEDRALTYRELDAQANQLAHYLRTQGVGPDSRVGLCVERSLAMVIGILGILKAGGAYVPLDPSYPADRLAYMLEHSAPSVVLIQAQLEARLPTMAMPVLRLDTEAALLTDYPATPLAKQDLGLTAKHLAYVIYTSGSTGQPKGVMNEHAGVVNRLLWGRDAYQLGDDDRILQKTPFGFDVSVWELLLPLLSGARLVMAQPGGHMDPQYLAEIIERERITTVHFVPSMLQVFLEHAPVERCRSLRRVLCSGEALPYALQTRFFAKLPAVELHNLYGPTEAAIEVTSWVCRTDVHEGVVPIGQPIANTQIYILDKHRQLVPMGVPGELYLGGAGVARGYLHRADLTAERFLDDPFQPGGRVYKTGDLGRWLPDGAIEYLGRNDFQVKIRGFRIELGEIEAQLAAATPLAAQTVIVRRDGGEPRLIAYVVPRDGTQLDVDALRGKLAGVLPSYMLPSAIVALDHMPVTPNGKIDRASLPAPSANRDERDGGYYVAPNTALEAQVAAVWAAVLGIERISVIESFFAAGGHSLLALQVVSRLRAALAIELPFRALFDAPTIRDLAATIATISPTEDRAIPRVDRAGALPLSFEQQRMWYLAQLEPGGFTYNVPWFLRLTGALDLAALTAALRRVIDRHDVLRTRYVELDGEPRQVIAPDATGVTLAVETVDESALAARAAHEAQQPFDLATGPLIRVRVLRVSANDHVLLFTMHHIVCDGWSIGVALRELGAAYRGEALAPLAIQYADFAAWQRAQLTGARLADDLAYWRAQLAGAPPVIELPLDRPRPAARTGRGAVIDRVLPASIALATRAFAQRESVSEFMTLLAAYGALLARYTGQPDVVIGSPIAGRDRGELEPLIGLFVNTLALRVDTAGELTFRQLVARVRETCLAAYAHQTLPFDRVVDALKPDRDPRTTPIFQVMFAVKTAQAADLGVPGLTARPLDVHPGMAKFELTLFAHLTDDGLATTWEYNTDLFDRPTIERMAAHFEILLGQLIADPDRALDQTPMIDAREHATLRAFGEAISPFPDDLSLHALFEAQVVRTPDALALTFANTELTYAALNARANQLAHHLISLGVTREDRVGVCLGRSVDFIVAVLATIKAGAAYVPLDPAYPAERLAYMTDDVRAKVVISRDWLTAADLTAHSSANPPITTTNRDLAHVMYTSGSTGRPKGTCIEQRAIARLVLATDYLQLTARDVVGHVSNTSFDAATFEIWGALLNGARLHGLAPDVVLSPELFTREIVASGLTVLLITTALFHQLAALAPDAFRTVDHLLFGGEVCDVAAVRRVLAVGPRRLLHVYGPTEATTLATWHPVRAVEPGATSIPIGRPVANTTIRILDRARQPAPIGVRGEIFIGGPGVARGYWNRPELTAERFVDDPLAPGERLYKTGDLAAWRADGTIEFHGRADHQVKLRGFRIELGELEAELLAHPDVTAAIAMVRHDTGDPRLVAYVAPPVDVDHLRDRLAAVLPRYMLPSAIVALDHMPVTPNGKIDRAALPAPSANRDERGGGYVAPDGELAQAIARIWAEVLGVDRVGAHDNFFALGGSSLLLVALRSRLEAVLGRPVALKSLAEAASVSELAARLADDTAASCLIRLQAGPKSPIYFIHGGGGSALTYRDLARAIDGERAMYGFNARGLDSDEPPHASIEAMASHYLALARSVHPGGPFLLVGASFGGTVAYEMARQLTAAGDSVALCALLDSPGPGALPVIELDSADLLVFHLETRRWLAADALRGRPLDEQLQITLDTAHAAGVALPFTSLAHGRRHVAVWENNIRALRAYTAPVWGGAIDFFSAADALPGSPTSHLDHAWRDRGALHVEVAGGDHLSMIAPPHVTTLGARIRTLIDTRTRSTAP